MLATRPNAYAASRIMLTVVKRIAWFMLPQAFLFVRGIARGSWTAA
jgi:hypothetical protein